MLRSFSTGCTSEIIISYLFMKNSFVKLTHRTMAAPNLTSPSFFRNVLHCASHRSFVQHRVQHIIFWKRLSYVLRTSAFHCRKQKKKRQSARIQPIYVSESFLAFVNPKKIARTCYLRWYNNCARRTRRSSARHWNDTYGWHWKMKRSVCPLPQLWNTPSKAPLVILRTTTGVVIR